MFINICELNYPFVRNSYTIQLDKQLTFNGKSVYSFSFHYCSNYIPDRSFLNRIAVTVIAEIIGQIAALSLAVFSRFTAAEIVVVIRCNAEEP